jgi:hypothetical protein
LAEELEGLLVVLALQPNRAGAVDQVVVLAERVPQAL